ncbi:4a-hydroxytetrahydrobiopterin dehydratase [Mesoterricola sediminis]|uniref:4a-hydroxytetrahydrobiopterin dehydratase n=1 Tax=Mesoterricola sediminis TaxID=2927980 RepID=A0AA48H1H4_9BACT|nr:4a-hydroxytetrahydrobiopterin dehydratase [Mesoterricola sediminis]BDU78270.1 4a-hydroxytetrahydrobiopterin dehydratase [Mesoterricola sediminis]
MTWIEKDNALEREIRTPDFLSAFNLVSRLVAPAEALNHHPDVAFGWGYVRIRLTTHDAGGLTDKDRTLAARIDEAIKPFAG